VTSLSELGREKYISLETFRKNGNGVKTPVWVATEEGKLYVWTMGESGKAKRIRHNSQVRLAQSDVRGNTTGEWTTAQARILNAPTELEKMQKRLQKKYGLAFRLFRLMGRLRGRVETNPIVIEISAA
jgi:PPOX class probable F420-dependent enzyme